MKRILLLLLVCLTFTSAKAAFLLLPMDDSQTNHLKAYGIAYWVLAKEVNVDWLLNYRGGSFAFQYSKAFERECLIRGVKFEVIPDVQMSKIITDIAHPEANMDAMRLEKPPKMAVYSPKSKLPWDDAVTLVLTYAEIPYDVIYDEEVLGEELHLYDWLHLHHEDFTGQYGKFYRSYKNAPWYRQQVTEFESMAKSHGHEKVSEHKLEVAHKIRDFVLGGGFLFAMCSATDTYDIALAAEGVDICHQVFDYDPIEQNAQQQLDFSKTFAFQDFTISLNPNEYEFSNIDTEVPRAVPQNRDYFTLFEFSAKWDPVPTMLTQCHTRTIPGFMGQTTSFRKQMIKPNVLVMGENKGMDEARYIHGEFGNGTWSFYGGHDPEDYRHLVGDPPTDLNLHPNSPGYRLILNNVLFPAAKKQKQKT
ncbi:MAG: asparagine synthetase B [Bacteroidetes bacterium]|nr:asparagine synthetase B [Bacteroidota bacterium]